MNKKRIFQLRIKSIIIDFVILEALFIPSVFLLLISGLGGNIYARAVVLSFFFSLFLCKDLVCGQSYGKYLCNLRVVGINGKPVHFVRLILRNVLIIIWPIEIVACFLNPERRLGDFIFNTKIEVEEKRGEQLKIKKNHYLIFAVVFIALLLLFYAILYFIFTSDSEISKILKLLYS